MKKALITLILISIILIFYKYCFSNYELNYDINGYKVYEQYNDKRFYYEIEKDNYKYNFDDNWSINASYAYVKVEDKVASADYTRDYNQFPNQYKFGVNYNNEKWDVEVIGRGASGCAKAEGFDY